MYKKHFIYMSSETFEWNIGFLLDVFSVSTRRRRGRKEKKRKQIRVITFIKWEFRFDSLMQKCNIFLARPSVPREICRLHSLEQAIFFAKLHMFHACFSSSLLFSSFAQLPLPLLLRFRLVLWCVYLQKVYNGNIVTVVAFNRIFNSIRIIKMPISTASLQNKLPIFYWSSFNLAQ